ncbi:MAG: amidophosphoribosyltransferase, partial [Planctomycetota bacterium]
MGGLFGAALKSDCVDKLFFGTDYHSHLGTVRGGMAVRDGKGISRYIHDITNAQFRSKFEDDLRKMSGNLGIGIISDYEDQPLIIASHLGKYGIVTVGVIQNANGLIERAFGDKGGHYSEMSWGEVNPTEIVATLINQADTFEDGIENAQSAIEGSCSLLLLTDKGIYAARDRLGRTPVTVGEGPDGFAATSETCAFPNLDFETRRVLGPGEVVRMTPEGFETLKPPGERMQVCSFLWVYYGFPASNYEGINVEAVRNRCGAVLARRDDVEVDLVAGVPDSGTAHAIGYATQAGLPYRRP